MHKAIEYYNQMVNLEGQGVPINWQGVARGMAVMISNEAPQADKPAPLPEPPQ